MMHDINARIGEIDAELETLAAIPEPSDEDTQRADALLVEREEMIAERKAQQERQERIAAAYKSVKKDGSGPEFKRPVDPYADDLRYLDPQQTLDAARAILDRPEARHVADRAKARFDRLIGSLGDPLARFTVATSRPEYRSAFLKYVAGLERELTNDERRAVAAVRMEGRAAGLTDAAGGYAVPALLDPSVIYTGDGTANPMRAISRIVTGLDDTWRGVSSAGITASWDTEATEVSDDTPTLAQPTVGAHKAQAFVPFSVEIEGDWQGMAAEMTELFQEAKDNLETTAHATGTGTAQPVGIITALVAGSGTVANVAPTTDGALGVEDVRALFGTLPPRYRRNASWVMSIDVQNEVRGFDTTGGLSLQTVDLQAPYNFQLLGRPVYEQSAFPSFTGTTGVANIMVVGDFRNYVIFDRVGSRVEFVPHLFGTTNARPTGQRGLLFWWRTGADSVNDNGFRLLRNT